MWNGGQMPNCQLTSPKSDDGDKRKVKSSGRQARIVYPYYPGVYPMNQGMGFAMNPLPPLPAPRVTPNSVLFQLVPNRSDLQFTFDIGISGQKVYLISSVSMLSFQINQRQFIDVKLPCEISKSIINGTNYISFGQNTTGVDITVELKFNIGSEIDNMVNHIVEILPKAETKHGDPFANSVCPISRQKIAIASRGKSCEHMQCFDLREFIVRAIETGNFCCPICGDLIYNFADLRYDPTYLQAVRTEESMFGDMLNDGLI